MLSRHMPSTSSLDYYIIGMIRNEASFHTLDTKTIYFYVLVNSIFYLMYFDSTDRRDKMYQNLSNSVIIWPILEPNLTALLPNHYVYDVKMFIYVILTCIEDIFIILFVNNNPVCTVFAQGFEIYQIIIGNFTQF